MNSKLLKESITENSQYVSQLTRSARPYGWHQTSLINPGDLIHFKYIDDGEYRLALVVINDTGNTMYRSLRDNTLLTTFLIRGDSETIQEILKTLYKDRRAERIEIVNNFKISLDIGSYRSFAIGKMRDIYSLELDRIALKHGNLK